MTGVILLDKLADILQGELEEVKLRTKGGEFRSPVVFRQHLPLPRTPKVKPRGGKQEEEPPQPPEEYGPEDFDANFPCVIVQLQDWNDTREIATAEINFLIGVYDDNPNAQGYRDVENIKDHIRLYLHQNQTIDRRYIMQFPLRGGLFKDQPWPVFFGWITATYALDNPAAEIKRRKGDWRDGTYPTKPEPR